MFNNELKNDWLWMVLLICAAIGAITVVLGVVWAILWLIKHVAIV